MILAIVFTTQLSRFEPPIGEKYLNLIDPGGYDFSFPYTGALDLLNGQSPYEREDQYYPPSYYLLSVLLYNELPLGGFGFLGFLVLLTACAVRSIVISPAHAQRHVLPPAADRRTLPDRR